MLDASLIAERRETESLVLSDVQVLSELLEKWAELALNLGWVEDWVEGAIFPREMVFLVARCEQLGIRCIIESGRQDGYSTRILGEYARRVGARVYSIDLEQEADRAERCRKRLSAYPELHLLKGNTNLLLGPLVRKHTPGPVAILSDGPKGFWAMSLLFASAGYGGVKLLALHNLGGSDGARGFFESLADEPVFYEFFAAARGGFWDKLAAAETSFCSRMGAKRSLDTSTLGIMLVSEKVRPRLMSVFHPKFRLYQPPIVRWGWRLGLYWPASHLYTLSFLLFRC